MKLKPGPTRRVHANKTRGAAFCGLGAFVGVGKTQRAHVYTAATLPVGSDDYKKIDPERLTRELEVDKCAVNSGRFWVVGVVGVVVDRVCLFVGPGANTQMSTIALIDTRLKIPGESIGTVVSTHETIRAAFKANEAFQKRMRGKRREGSCPHENRDAQKYGWATVSM